MVGKVSMPLFSICHETRQSLATDRYPSPDG